MAKWTAARRKAFGVMMRQRHAEAKDAKLRAEGAAQLVARDLAVKAPWRRGKVAGKGESRIQPRIVDHRGRVIPRVPMSAFLMQEIDAAIDFTAKKFNKSRSFVVATGMMTFFGIDGPRYDE